jgi:geranylgeranyl diphosphate synthase type II
MLRALGRLAAATGVDGMVGGQYLDVAAAPAGPGGLRRLHALKTGRLIGRPLSACCCSAGGRT